MLFFFFWSKDQFIKKGQESRTPEGIQSKGRQEMKQPSLTSSEEGKELTSIEINKASNKIKLSKQGSGGKVSHLIGEHKLRRVVAVRPICLDPPSGKQAWPPSELIGWLVERPNTI